MIFKRAISLLLTFIICVLYLPVTFASGNSEVERIINIGTNHIKNAQLSKIYFGRYPQGNLGATKPEYGLEYIDWIRDDEATENGQGPYYSKDPIKWRVLKNTGDKLFVVSDKNLNKDFYNRGGGRITWEKSTIRSWLNGYPASYNTIGIDFVNDNFLNSAFSLQEQAFIPVTRVKNDIYYWNTHGGNDTDDKIFLLSVENVEDPEYGFINGSDPTILRQAYNTAYTYGHGRYGTNTTDRWWLRSPGTQYQFQFIAIGFGGEIKYAGVETYYYDFCIRPAMNLDASKVLFTSGTDAGYTLTFRDENRNFKISDISAKEVKPGDVISFDYENAKTGTNEYISAVVTDSLSNVLKYFNIKKSEDESGNISFVVPEDINPGEYTLKLFNEKYNGEGFVNFSSDFVNIPLKVNKKPEFKILSYSISDGKPLVTMKINEIGQYSLIIVDYESQRLNDIDVVPVNVTEDTLEEFSQSGIKNITLNKGDRIMLWNSFTNLMPLCNTFIIE